MASLFNTEEQLSSKPIILLLCDNEQLIKTLIAYYRRDFKIIAINPRLATSAEQSIYIVHPEKTPMLANIHEKIDYALIIATTAQDLTTMHVLDEKLRKDSTHLITALPVYNPSFWLTELSTLPANKHQFIVFFGNIFGLHTTIESEVLNMVQTALTEQRIKLHGNDLSPIYPISERDFLQGLNMILFGSNAKSKFFYLFYKHPQTIISAIHLLKRSEPDLEVLYDETRQAPVARHIPLSIVETEIRQITNHTPLYIDSHLLGFEKSIDEIMHRYEVKPESLAQPAQKARRKQVSTKGFSFFLSILMLGMVLFATATAAAAIGSVFLAEQSVKQISQGNIGQSKRFFAQSLMLSKLTGPQFVLAEPLLAKIVPQQTKEYSLFLEGLEQVNSTHIFDLANSSELSRDSSLISDLEFWYWRAQQFGVEYPQIRLMSLLNPTNTNLLRLFHETSELAGYSEKQTYLLLLQNENELRPNGGFIGSVGLLTLDNGKIQSLKIDDVYNVDGQIKGHIEPPFVVRRNLQPHLYLRDSNFNPDFEKSATSAAQLYTLATGTQLNGVVAINTDFLTTLLKITGPIKLSQFNQTITAQNASHLLQDQIEKDFFPGSTKKKDVLNALLNQLTVQFEENPSYKAKLVSQLPTLFANKTIQMASKNISMEKLVKALGFGGTLTDNREEQDNMIRDIAGIYEANIGVNKVNDTTKRNVSYSIGLNGTGQTQSTINLAITNPNETEEYISYLQVVMPLGSVVNDISIDGAKQDITDAITDPRIYEAKNFKKPTQLEVEMRVEDTDTIAGFIVKIPPHTSQNIAVTYKNGAVGALSSIVNYSLLYFKQSGTGTYPLTATINYPAGYNPEKIKGASFTENGVVFKQKVTGDSLFNVHLIKN